ncbi:MAG TPA: SDR family oxidoreductase, partial [Candidatus Binataceae bacterium]|nr:SDR family oxidoreductase [Candidatus Binataceae bacterium]
RSVFLGMKHVAPVMKRQGSGSIVSTASVAGLRTGHGPHAYSAAKAAVISITESAAIDLGHDRIRVNCICPGGIVTPLTYKTMPGGEEAAIKNMARMQPIPRAGKPEDIANMALFLASDESEWITGTAMIVDGGMATGNARMTQFGSGFSGPSFERHQR